MGDLLEALQRAKLVTPIVAEAARAQEREKLLRLSGVQIRQLENPGNRAVTPENLDAAESPRAFRVLAMNMLLADPGAISQVVKSVHRLKEVEGGRRLIASILGLRDQLATADKEDVPGIITRALRGAGREVGPRRK